MNLDHAIHQLKTMDSKGKLFSRRDFARSLISQFDAKGRLSAKQEEWVGIIISENLNRTSENTQIKIDKISGLDRVNEIFDAATEKLQYPKLVIQLADGSDLKLNRAGPKSRFNGAVMLTDGRPFGDNKYYGNVANGELTLTTEGKLRASELENILRSMNTDLGQFAKMYGLKTGNCCFCRKELSHDHSLVAGYGPVCADNYGLPWGEKA
jgi:hypothetical protein